MVSRIKHFGMTAKNWLQPVPSRSDQQAVSAESARHAPDAVCTVLGS